MARVYGEIVEDLVINGKKVHYPVVNERAIRASAGLMFLVGISTIFYLFMTGDYNILYYVAPIMWIEFFLKVVFGPKYSFFAYIGDKLVKHQKPEYVGAIQKRFAWSIGLTLLTSLLFVVALNIKGPTPLVIYGICLFFLWTQASIGFCLGCKIYQLLEERELIKSKEHPACPGGSCDVDDS